MQRTLWCMALLFFCTINLNSNVYYDLRLECKDFGGPSFLQLQWQSTSQLPQVTPSSRLFWAVTTASFSTQFVTSSSTLATFTVGSTPPPLIASIYGNDLTATTAGVAAAFTLVTRDTYSNVRESADAVGSWRAVAWSDAGQIATLTVTPTLTFNSGIPGYVGAYTESLRNLRVTCRCRFRSVFWVVSSPRITRMST